MKSISRFSGSVAAIFFMVTMVTMATLTACATNQDEQHGQHHPDSSASPAAGIMKNGPSGESMAMKDMKAMCNMHEKMMAAKTPEERLAMMDERMKAMSPEMMQKHMGMMKEKCH